ncbi:MAG TPA: acyltransferase [Beijerinckiaceae bacterium]|jgi:peptidoglycan/LPS O-acetylase OafA/YrhL
MKSTTGEHFVALDQIRAVAAFMVFAWHFTHADQGTPLPFEGAPWFVPLTLVDEGHTGVSLFMTLSGYLFAKLLNGRTVDYGPFLWNRFLRLAPLLGLVIILAGVQRSVQGLPMMPYAQSVLQGIVAPSLPNGGWSITVEAHFYFLLPLILWLSRRWAPWLIICLLGAVMVRALLYARFGEVQSVSCWTIIGRIDQFLIGIFLFQCRVCFVKRHLLAVVVAALFIVFHWSFNAAGGYYGTSKSPIWIVLPTIEGMACGLLIAYYDGSFSLQNKGFSRVLGLIGTYSYSIYLLHVFVVFDLAAVIDERVMKLSNIYSATIWAIICFGLMVPVGYLSARYIEAPFLRLRKSYTGAAAATSRPDALTSASATPSPHPAVWRPQ